MSINKELRNRLDFVRGSLIGGAAGDALGYPIEFDHYSQIIAKYGKQGITQYELTNGVAEISDDTQMCSGIGLDGKLDYGMMFGMDDGHVIAVSPFWYEVRDGQKYYRLSKQITKPSKMYRTK